MLAQQDVEDDAVDPVVAAVVGEHAHRVASLAVAVDAALALLVAGRVPGEVVVDDRVEVLLEVDALARGSRSRRARARLPRRARATRCLALGGRERAGDRLDLDVLRQLRAQRVGDVVGGRR